MAEAIETEEVAFTFVGICVERTGGEVGGPQHREEPWREHMEEAMVRHHHHHLLLLVVIIGLEEPQATRPGTLQDQTFLKTHFLQLTGYLNLVIRKQRLQPYAKTVA